MSRAERAFQVGASTTAGLAVAALLAWLFAGFALIGLEMPAVPGFTILAVAGLATGWRVFRWIGSAVSS